MDCLRGVVDHVKDNSLKLWESCSDNYVFSIDKKTIIITLTAGGLTYICYKLCSARAVPPMPKLDLDYWWGPEELRDKQDKTLRRFRVEFSEDMIIDLRQRLSMRRKFTPPLEGVNFNYGFNTEYLESVLDFWKDNYNFHERQEFFNKFDHFKTNIQGLDIHFIHVTPNSKDITTEGVNVRVLPLLLLHGWPGSVREFYEIIPLLTTKRSGYDYVFEVIVPSLPGYGFSSAAVRPNLGAAEIAVVMRNLMHRLGYSKFYVQGGDWGSTIGTNLATIFPDEILGFHSNLLFMKGLGDQFKVWLGSFWPSCMISEKHQDRLYPFWRKFLFTLNESGYMHLQATKPDTVGVALTDSPAGLASYILEKFSTWTNSNYRDLPDGGLTKKYKLTDLLDNIMVYWSTSSITTSMRLYAETLNLRHAGLGLEKIPTHVPVWVLKTKYELAFTPDRFLKKKYPNLLHSTVLDDGGHFAAFEMPHILADEVFEAVNAFIAFNEKNRN